MRGNLISKNLLLKSIEVTPQFDSVHDLLKAYIESFPTVDDEYVVKKWTKEMANDADECEKMEEQGKSKDCCECACNVCLIQ